MNRTLSIVALTTLASLGLAASYGLQRLSAGPVEAQRHAIDSRQLFDLLPPSSFDNQPLQQPLALSNTELAHSTLLGGYLATRTGRPAAVLLRSQTTGYSSTIELLLAIDVNGRLLGVKTIKQGETPGLGGRIGEWPNAWLQTFTGKSLAEPAANQWALKKDAGAFDQIAGATLTSRAAVNAIHDGLRYFDEHRLALLGEKAP